MRLSKRLKSLSPYVAGEQPQDRKYIKLNTNENPYPPSSAVLSALKGFEHESLKLYPDPNSLALRAAIAKKEGVCVENIFVGNGSDEVLAFAFYALFDRVAFFDITYSFYNVYAKMFDIDYLTIPLKADFSVDMDGLLKLEGCGLAIANPNAPTSLALKRDDIEKVLRSTTFPVLVDEAYIDFAAQNISTRELYGKYKNLIVVKTLSKSYSLAGLRCGYAVGSKEIIDALNFVKDSFNSYPVDRVCSCLSIAALSDEEYHAQCCKKIIATRERTAKALIGLGFTVLPSQTNFLFVSAKALELSGYELYSVLKQNGYLVRHFNSDRIKDYVRITIGTDEQMNGLIDFLKLNLLID